MSNTTNGVDRLAPTSSVERNVPIPRRNSDIPIPASRRNSARGTRRSDGSRSSRDYSSAAERRPRRSDGTINDLEYWEVEEAIRLLQDVLPRISDALLSPSLPPPYEYEESLFNDQNVASEDNTVANSRPLLCERAENKGSRTSIVSTNQRHSTINVAANDHPTEKTPLLGNERPDEPKKCCSSCGHYSRMQICTLVSMLLLDITSFAAMSILAPFFPAVISKRGLSSTINGIVFSTYGLVVLITSPIVGILVPKITPRKCYLIGIFLSAVSNCAFGLTPLIMNDVLFVATCIILRGFAALGSTCFFIVIYGIVPIIYPDDINTITGMLETAIGLGMCVGPALGGWLNSIGGFALPFFALGGLLFVVFPVSFCIFPDTEIPESTRKIKVCEMLCRSSIIRPAVVLVVIGICNSGLYPTLQPHMNLLGVSEGYVSLVYLLESAVYSIFSPIVGIVIDRFNCAPYISGVGLVLITIALILLGSSPILPLESRKMLLTQDDISIVLLGLSSAMCIVPTYAEMLEAASGGVPQTDFAVTSFIGGFWSAAYSFGEMIGPLYTGILSEYLSFASTTSIIALLPLILVIVLGLEAFVKLLIRSKN